MFWWLKRNLKFNLVGSSNIQGPNSMDCLITKMSYIVTGCLWIDTKITIAISVDFLYLWHYWKLASNWHIKRHIITAVYLIETVSDVKRRTEAVLLT